MACGRSSLIVLVLAAAVSAFVPQAPLRINTCQAAVSKPAIRVADATMFGGSKSAGPKKKPIRKAVAAKKAAPKKVMKKTAPKKVVGRVVSTKKVAKKPVAKKPVAKKPAAKKPAAKKTVAKAAPSSGGGLFGLFVSRGATASQTAAKANAARKISPEAAKRIREKENAARKKAIEQKAAAKRALSRQKGGALARRLRAEDVQKQKTAQDKQLAAKRMAAAKAAYNAKIKIKNDEFKLAKKTKAAAAGGKTARI
jgi:hypothetical protein